MKSLYKKPTIEVIEVRLTHLMDPSPGDIDPDDTLGKGNDGEVVADDEIETTATDNVFEFTTDEKE